MASPARCKEPGRAAFRPTGLAVAPDGALYISDDKHGRIWRITYARRSDTTVAPAPAARRRRRGVRGVRRRKASIPMPVDALPVCPPPGATMEQVALGDRIFHGEAANGTCSGCHGSDAGGSPQAPSLINGNWLWSDGSLAAITRAIATACRSRSNIRAPCRPRGRAAIEIRSRRGRGLCLGDQPPRQQVKMISFQSQRVAPLAAHIVVGHRLLAGGAGEDLCASLDRPRRAGGSKACLQPVELRAILAARQIEHRPAIDPVSFEDAAPTREIPADWRRRHHHMIEQARPVGEGEAAGALGAGGFGGVVKEHAARIQVVFDEAEKLGGQEVGDVGAEVPGGVRDDGIKAPVGICPQPTAAVVGDDGDLWVAQQRGDFRRLGNQCHIARINLDNGE